MAKLFSMSKEWEQNCSNAFIAFVAFVSHGRGHKRKESLAANEHVKKKFGCERTIGLVV